VKAKGYHVIYREFDDLGARTYHPASNDDAIAWATRLRNKNIPPSAEEWKLLQHAGQGGERAFEELALVGGVPAGAVVQVLLGKADPRVRAAAAETCTRAIFSESTVAVVGGKLADPSPAVRRAALRALAVNANWRSQAAQQALIGLATNAAADHVDRAGAVDGLGQAVRFQVKGVRQDPPLFQALIALLDDKDEELRVMASNILAPIRDSDFRGDLGRPERKAPAGGWQQWLAEITAKDAGYQKDYEACRGAETGELVSLFCKGGSSLPKQPALAFKYTLEAAEKGYVPAEAAVGMMYANGKGVEQNYAEAGKWWIKAAEGGHLLAADNASMLYRSGVGVKPDAELANKWAKFVAEHSSNTSH
jgi:TPR repeat protein